MPNQISTPCLVGLQPESLRGSLFELSADHVLVGRDGGCDVILNDPRVSRRHASLRRGGAGMVVHDLGSRGGTWINDHRLTGPMAVHDGDVVTFAGVSLRFQHHAGRPGGPETLMWEPASRPAATPRFDVEQQRGDVISNVGRDQYNSYVQHVMHERQSFLRDIAATRSKAWILVCFGFLLVIVGFGVWAANIFNFIDNVQNVGPGTEPGDLPLLGRKLFGIPVAVYGFVGMVLGMTMVIIGIVLHIVAAARRRRLPTIPPPPRY